MRQPKTPAGGEIGHPARESARKTGTTRWLGSVRRLGLLAALAILPTVLFATPAAAVIAPVVQNVPPTSVPGGVELKGKIYTYESDTRYHFEYGTTTAYGTSVPVPEGDAGVEAIATVAQTITGLAPNTTYHYRLVASNAGGRGEGSDATFDTSEAAAPLPPPSGGEEGPRGGNGPTPSKGAKVRLKVERVGKKRVLAAANGHTLYSLSVEKKGRFVCTKSSGCLTLWKPLLVPNGGSVVGPVKLGSIKRPDGGRQVTYGGRPLYTFAQDSGPGKANGEGFKDVGTWHAASLPKAKPKR
jgi:predicted lipoprotein with Yx(FWY)xxD motif